jgi:hypothetical protein
MENQAPHQSIPNRFKRPLEGASTVLVLGILSLVFMGLVGLILGIIALSKSKELKSRYELDPGAYDESSYKNMNAGRVCALISVIISSIAVFFILILVITAIAANA